MRVMSYSLRRPAATRPPRDDTLDVIIERRFTLALQPVFRVRDRTADHAEALLRLATPGSLTPAAFVAAAEAKGHGPALDAAVLAVSCALPRPISVNICARSLQLHRFADTVLDAAPEAIELVRLDAVDDLAAVAAAVADIRAAGVRVALDGVNGGAASLALVQAARFDTFKLAGGVLRAAMAGPRGRTLLAELLRLATALGARPIATRIETLPQLWAAEGAGIELAQGWLLGAPAAA